MKKNNSAYATLPLLLAINGCWKWQKIPTHLNWKSSRFCNFVDYNAVILFKYCEFRRISYYASFIFHLWHFQLKGFSSWNLWLIRGKEKGEMMNISYPLISSGYLFKVFTLIRSYLPRWLISPWKRKISGLSKQRVAKKVTRCLSITHILG